MIKIQERENSFSKKFNGSTSLFKLRRTDSTSFYELRRTDLSNVKSGFSFIELVMAITIMAILVAGTITVSVRYIAKAKVSSTKSIIQAAQTAIDSFYMDTNQYPSTLNDLIQQPSDPKIAKKWQAGYWTKKNAPQDAWGNDLVYKPTKGSAHPYELYSWGANGEGSDAKEQISVWELE